MLNAICRSALPFSHKNQAPSGLLKINYCKFFCNSATVQFYLQNCDRIALQHNSKTKKLFYCVNSSLSVSRLSLCLSIFDSLSFQSSFTPSLQIQNSRSVWWHRDRRLGFGLGIGVQVWCGDRRWAVGLPWVLFRFVVGSNQHG